MTSCELVSNTVKSVLAQHEQQRETSQKQYQQGIVHSQHEPHVNEIKKWQYLNIKDAIYRK